MTVRVAAAGGSPTWRRGMSVVLEGGGYEAVAFEDLKQWEPGRGGQVVVAWVGDDDPDAIAAFSDAFPHIPVVAVVPNLTVASLARMMRSGAAGTVDDGDSEDVVLEVLAATLAERASIRLDHLRSLAELVPDTENLEAWLSEEEASWLRMMSEGVTVGELAERVGYSERAMFRLLRHLYRRIGAHNRTEALLWASRSGLLSR